MVHQDLQIGLIYHAITPWHWADITQRLICSPISNHREQIAHPHVSVFIEVHYGLDRSLAVEPCGTEIQRRAIRGDLRARYPLSVYSGTEVYRRTPAIVCRGPNAHEDPMSCPVQEEQGQAIT